MKRFGIMLLAVLMAVMMATVAWAEHGSGAGGITPHGQTTQ